VSRRLQDNIAAGAFLLAFAGALALSLDFGPRARMIPLPLAIFGIVLALIQLVWQNLGSTDALKMDMIRVDDPAAVRSEQAAEAHGGESTSTEPTRSKQAGAYVIVLGLLALVVLIGPLPAVFVFTAGYFIVTRYCSPLMSLLYAGAFALVIYLVFFLALQIQPYHGILAPLFALFDR
jgi:hypothetical protein